MKKTRFLMMLLTFMLIFGTVLTFVSCGGTTTTECTEHKDENGDGICDTEGCGATVEKPDASADAFNENGELYLFKGGVPTFQFVIGTDALSKHKATVDDLATVLNGLHDGEDIKVFAQTEGSEQTVEILIGTVTNRDAKYNVNKYDYGNTGYTVQQIGTKIIVTGGSDTAIANALNHLKNNVFGIKKYNDNFVDFVMSADKKYENKQNNYSLKEITVAGNSIRDYVITYPSGDKAAETNAQNLQQNLYDKCGIRLEIMREAQASGKLKVAFRTIENDGKGDGFYVTVDSDKNLNIECEYATLNVKITTDYFNTMVFSKRNTLNFEENLSYSENHRDIYYKDYAVGDGETDDFFNLKKVHDLANENLLNVYADPEQTYYIGASNGKETITVKTNTYWNGCKFIFDDREVNWKGSAKDAPIFSITPNAKSASYDSKVGVPFTTLQKGATKIDWKPGSKVVLIVYQSDIKHYIRSGTNENSGDPQQEMIVVDQDGNIDPSTPVQWTYTNITKVDLFFVDENPIEIRGEGKDGKMTEISTHHNLGPNTYWYFSRNIEITRSNVTLSGIKHSYETYGSTGCPYTGFTQISNCTNVTVDNCIYESAPRYRDNEIDKNNRPTSMPKPTDGVMGTYEISAEHANNVIWSNSEQSNFFKSDGTLHTNGVMGTNYCKNLTFDNMDVTTFDAHCGVYNVTIKDSKVMTLNIIGAGKVIIKDVIAYADGQLRSPINLRDDYGSTFNGDFDIDGLHIKIKKITADDEKLFQNQGGLRIFHAKYENHFYGYTTYLTRNISLKNILVEEYTLDMSSGTREEVHSAYNNYELKLFTSDINTSSRNYYRDQYFGSEKNVNPMTPPEKIEYFSVYTGKYAELGITTKLNLVLPTKNHPNGTTMFSDTEYWRDGVLSPN